MAAPARGTRTAPPHHDRARPQPGPRHFLNRKARQNGGARARQSTRPQILRSMIDQTLAARGIWRNVAGSGPEAFLRQINQVNPERDCSCSCNNHRANSDRPRPCPSAGMGSWCSIFAQHGALGRPARHAPGLHEGSGANEQTEPLRRWSNRAFVVPVPLAVHQDHIGVNDPGAPLYRAGPLRPLALPQWAEAAIRRPGPWRRAS